MSSSQSARKRLPVKPSEENVKKQAKRRAKLENIQLADAQHRLASDYGCRNWTELMQLVEAMNRGAGVPLMSSSGAPNKPIQAAARAKNTDAVRRLLGAGQYSQEELDSGLAGALWYGDPTSQWPQMKTIADLLLEHGADANAFITTYGPIVFGTGECIQPESLQYLVDAGADVTFAPIETKYGMQCPMSYALGTYARGANDRKHRMIDILLRHGAFVPPEVTPAMMAIHRGDARGLADLLREDASLVRQRFADMPYGNIQLRGASLLHCAVEFDEIACCDVLFDHWADINTKADIIEGIGGQTPIFHLINTGAASHLKTLEHVMKRVGQYIDVTVRATWRTWEGARTIAVTPLEYAEEPVNKNGQAEIFLLRSLDRRGKVRRACAAGDVPAIARMLDESPELLTPELWPPAIFQAKSLELTRLLLDRGLNPDECSAPRKPLHLAVYQCLADIVELLIEHGANVNQTNPLGERPIDLLDAYEPRPIGDPDARRIRRALLAAGAKDDIHSAVRACDAAEVRRILIADPSQLETPQPWPPLFSAARSGRVELAKLLIEYGAEVNAHNAKGNTPLWFACQSPARAEDRIGVATLLIESGARIGEICEDGTTALHFAAWRGPLQIVELLIRHGATVSQADSKRRLPVDFALEGRSAEREKIVQVLASAP